MKRSLFILALALVLVFSFSAIAGAKYAGYAGSGVRYDGAAQNASVLSNAPGYMSWGAAVAQMQARGITGAALATPHGGYSIATAKCAVCHSAHRAIGKPGIPNTVTGAGPEGMVLAPGSGAVGTCLECHTEWGSVGTGKPIEWAQTGSGPHGSSGCSTCHLGGIHGSGTSAYWGMNAFMLGGVNDAQIAAEVNTSATGNWVAGTLVPTGPAATTGWFWTGTTAPATVGGIPAGMNANVWAQQKQLLTGYSCSRAGCHTNSALAVSYWGWSAVREQRASGATSFSVATTGHKAAPGTNGNHAGANCGPCHAGNPAGGYRVASANATGLPDTGPVVGGVAQGQRSTNNARAYGCDQCHDMVGVLTNSTAFPHANRNIAVFEWNTQNTKFITNPQGSGNLWMYTGNIAGYATNGNAIDPSFRVSNNAVGSGTNLGQWRDGVCFKCHVPIDRLSAEMMSGDANSILIARQHGRANFAGATFPGYNATGAGLATWTTYLFK